jgi:hypothetical protein
LAFYRLCSFRGMDAPFAKFVLEDFAPLKVCFFGLLLMQVWIL